MKSLPNQEHSAPRRRDLLKAAGAALLGTELAARPRRSAAQGVVNLTLWAWTPKLQNEIDLFEQAHPGIRVQWANVGQGVPHYTKIRTALKAGTGMPDVAQVEYQFLPSFRLLDALIDIAPYGAGKIAGDFVPWTWAQVGEGGKVFGIPWDSGPVGLLYREDIFEKFGITLPRTWDDFAETAMRLSSKTQDVFLTDMILNSPSWMIGAFWQAGWNPFHTEGTSFSAAINDTAAKKVAAYWQKLLDARAVDAQPAYTVDWYASYDRGRYATWFTAAWGPAFLSQFAKTSAGQWRVAPPPVWEAGKYVSANMGGSTLAVTKHSAHPAEAAELAMWLLHDPASTGMMSEKQFVFPATTALLDSPGFRNITDPFYGGQKVNEVFVESAKHVDRIIEWSPFHEYTVAQFIVEFTAAAGGKGTLVQALDRLQDGIVKYAKAQGFTVKA